VPPSLGKAADFRAEQVYMGAHCKLSKAKMTEAIELGIGMTMFFQIQKSLAILLFFMTLLSAP
jgi:hypothetical protein